MHFDGSYFIHLLFSTEFLEPVLTVIVIAAASMAFGVAVGIIGGIALTSEAMVPRQVARAYVTVVRGIPALVQIVFWYNGLPALTGGAVNLPAVAAGVLALGINEGAYMTEIVRSGIQLVSRGQREAARALGLGPVLTLRKVVLPQAVRVAIPPSGNQVLNLVKDTSLLFAIAIPEIFGTGINIYSMNFKYFEVIAVVATWYFLLSCAWGLIQRGLERRFGRGQSGPAGMPA
jgi:His/Glu/Gln/Arg/opine family amino acid ABC transporter permease subunit